MTVITLTPDIEASLKAAAQHSGSTPESLALESLRKAFVQGESVPDSSNGKTLFDFLQPHIGTIDGTREALSEDCGRSFTDHLADKHKRGHL